MCVANFVRRVADKTHRISFWAERDTVDSEGTVTKEFAEIRKAWASVVHKSGAQQWVSGGYDAKVTDLFTIYCVPGWEPDSTMQLHWRGKAYDIESVDNIRGENLELEIRAVYVGPSKGR